MLIDREELETLIPHAGAMCLLDGVVAWDERRITCVSRTHLAAENPLRAADGLAGLNAIEYGAQAAAVHGGLIARAQGRPMIPGWLAGVTEATFEVARLDEVVGPLTAEAELLQAEPAGVIYRIEVSGDGRSLARARVSILHRREFCAAQASPA